MSYKLYLEEIVDKSEIYNFTQIIALSDYPKLGTLCRESDIIYRPETKMDYEETYARKGLHKHSLYLGEVGSNPFTDSVHLVIEDLELGAIYNRTSDYLWSGYVGQIQRVLSMLSENEEQIQQTNDQILLYSLSLMPGFFRVPAEIIAKGIESIRQWIEELAVKIPEKERAYYTIEQASVGVRTISQLSASAKAYDLVDPDFLATTERELIDHGNQFYQIESEQYKQAILDKFIPGRMFARYA